MLDNRRLFTDEVLEILLLTELVATAGSWGKLCSLSGL